MSQFEMPTINPTTYSGTDLAADLNAWSDSVLSGNSGTSRPSYAVAGTPWYNTSTSKLKLYDGSSDFTIPYGDITSYGTSLIESADATAARTLLACAPLASPAFTGAPTAPTQTAGDNSTKLATTAYVDSASSPSVDRAQWPTVAVNAVDSEHDIDFIDGKILDSTGYELITATAMTKQIDAAWAVGDNAGGLFSGAALTADSTIYCFIIVKDSDGSVDAGFDDNSTADNIPAGYTSYRRIAKLRLDGSSNIIPFHQYGDYFYFDSMITDIDTTTPSTSRVAVSVSAPDSSVGIFSSELSTASSSSILITSESQDDETPSGINRTLAVGSGAVLSLKDITIPVSSSGEIYYRSSIGSASFFKIRSLGWIDQRID